MNDENAAKLHDAFMEIDSEKGQELRDAQRFIMTILTVLNVGKVIIVSGNEELVVRYVFRDAYVGIEPVVTKLLLV